MERFNDLLLDTMDDTMKQVLGEATSELIYRFMKRNALLKREEIAKRIEIFYTYLEKLLGSEGAQIIRATSIKRLCLRLRREYEEIEKYFSFLDELYEIKFKLLAPLLKEKRSVCN